MLSDSLPILEHLCIISVEKQFFGLSFDDFKQYLNFETVKIVNKQIQCLFFSNLYIRKLGFLLKFDIEDIADDVYELKHK